MPKQPSRIPVYEVAPATDAEFARLCQEVLDRLLKPKPVVAEAAKDEVPREEPAGKSDEDTQSPKPWEMSPQEFGAMAMTALWPEAESAHQWVPRPPMSLDEYLRDGV